MNCNKRLNNWLRAPFVCTWLLNACTEALLIELVQGGVEGTSVDEGCIDMVSFGILVGLTAINDGFFPVGHEPKQNKVGVILLG